MIHSRHFPRSVDALLDLLLETTGGADRLTAQAGHFLLYYDSVEDQVLPCISTELNSPRHALLRDEIGFFPILSWDLALAFLSRLPEVERTLMVVVNDWQYLPDGVDRARFYSRYRHLPPLYQERLRALAPAARLLTPPSTASTYPFFGEGNLRNRYKRLVEELVSENRLPAGAVIAEGERNLVCSLPDILGRRMEVYCSSKSADCAAEVAMMLRTARQSAGIRCFVSFYPLVCREFVERGTELGDALFQTGIETVVNVGLPASDVHSVDDLLREAEVAIHRFPPR